MINKYTRPSLIIKHWCVTKEDLYKLYTFFIRRFTSDNIPIELETASGNNKVYKNFNELSEDISKLLIDKEIIKKIEISHRISDPKNWSKNKQIWIDIDFSFQSVGFHIIAEDTDGTYKDWVDGAYEEMCRIFSSFQYNSEFVKIMNEHYKIRRYADSVIVFDYNGEIRKRIEDKIRLKEREISKLAPKKEPWYKQWWMFYLVYPFIVTLIIFIISKSF